MARPDKAAAVAELTEKFKAHDNVYLADFTGLNVADTTELRRLLRAADVEYRVVKNTLARRAADEAGVDEGIADLFVGPTAVAFGRSDSAAPARVLADFRKKHEKELPAIKGGVLAGHFVGPDDVQRIAKLPGRDQLLGHLAGALSAPMTGFAGAMQAVLRSFANVLTQVQEQKTD